MTEKSTPTGYSVAQLNQIIEQAMVYQCACPAQVSKLLIELSLLAQYQRDCLEETSANAQVHQRIREAIAAVRPEVEACLTDILTIEGWDMGTLEMPDDLKKRMIDDLTG